MTIRIKKSVRKKPEYIYQKSSRFFAQISESAKEAGVEELAEFGNLVIITDPPYGIRIGKCIDPHFQKKLSGDLLKYYA